MPNKAVKPHPEPNKKLTAKSMQKTLFLDRDGVINVNHGYVHKKEDFILIDGIVELIRHANQLGYLVIVVTNQSGIGRGLYTEQQFLDFNDWMLDSLLQQEARVDKVYYCPHHPSEALGNYAKNCECRKPKPGMALNAINDFGLDISAAIMVGDSASDVEFAVKANIPEIYWLSSQHEAFIINYHCATTVTKINNLREIHLN